MNIKDFLSEFGESLRNKLKLRPVYDPENLDEWDKESMEKVNKIIQETKRKDIPAQKNAILAVAKGFYQRGKKSVILVGEMATGKTFCTVVVPALSGKKNYRVIVMCPGHLVRKWMREIRQTYPNATIVNLNNPGLKELFALKGRKAQGLEFYVVGKERASNHFAWKPAVNMRGEDPYCPDCGKVIDVEEMRASYENRKIKCPNCESPLWQADREGPRRFAKAEYIKRHLKGSYDLFIPDELHKYKGGETAQGQALACLAASSRQTLAATGTLMGGYATNLFYLFWRMFPRLMVDKAPYRAEKTFAGKYGVLEFIRKERLEDNAQSLGGQKAKEVVKEKPGVSPLLLNDFLLENAVFLRLADMADYLPSYTEEVVGVQMLPEQEAAYKKLEHDLRAACSKAVAMGDLSLLGALVNSLLSYPDCCRRGETVIHPRTGEFVAGAPAIETSLTPKEERLLKLVQSQLAQGRKCTICLENTGKRDLHPTLVERLEKLGVSTLVLRAGKPRVDKRESFIKSMEPYHDVMATNPKLIETGLDLIEFPTFIFFQTGYSVYTLRQASRRPWRIGQEKEVKVFYLSYLDTMQEKALVLMASKLETALAVEGELSDKGLVALADSGNSMMLELARSLIDKQETPSLEEAWQGYKKQELIAEALLTNAEKPGEFCEEVEILTETALSTTITPQEATAPPAPCELDTGEQQVIVETKTETTITHGNHQAKITVTRVVRGKAYRKKKTADSPLFHIETPNPEEDYEFEGYVGSNRFLFRGGQVFYKGKVVGEYDLEYRGKINNKPMELVKSGKAYVIVELQQEAA